MKMKERKPLYGKPNDLKALERSN